MGVGNLAAPPAYMLLVSLCALRSVRYAVSVVGFDLHLGGFFYPGVGKLKAPPLFALGLKTPADPPIGPNSPRSII